MIEQKTFSEWLFSDAGAGWAVALIAIAGHVVSFIRRRRAVRVVVREMGRASLVSVSSAVRNQIEVTFVGQPVSNLGLVQLQISNHGSDPISDVRFSVSTRAPTKILLGYQVPDTSAVSVEFTKGSDSEMTVGIPYLNNAAEHHHVLRVGVIVDGTDEELIVRGSGAGWSVRHTKMLTDDQQKRRMYTILGCAAALFLLMLPYNWWVQRHWGIDPSKVTWASSVASAPFWLVLLALCNWIIRTIRGQSFWNR